MLVYLTDMVSNLSLLSVQYRQVRCDANGFFGYAAGGYATAEWLASKLLTYLEREWNSAAPEMAVSEAFLQADAKVTQPADLKPSASRALRSDDPLSGRSWDHV